MFHKASVHVSKLVWNRRIKSALTNFPQPGTELLVVIEHTRELITVIQYTHQFE